MKISANRSPYYSTQYGSAYLGDTLDLIADVEDSSVDLICTSPPFPLLRQKRYGNAQAREYLKWFVPYALQFKRILKPDGSLVIDLGGSWLKGLPYRSLYQYELLIELCKPLEDGGEFGFFLAQELYWYNPAKLPTPAEWVTIRRTRVKDAVNTVWWLRPSAIVDPKDGKISNRRVLKPYSKAQKRLMKDGYSPNLRPSEHNISKKFGTNNGGAIPPNLIDATDVNDLIGAPVPVNVISASNTSSNDLYQRRCREENVPRHPARFPAALPEFVIGICTETDDLVLDPFAGSNTTGAVAQKMGRRWLSFEIEEEYLFGSKFRFPELYDNSVESQLSLDV